jgi:hypothetical protein
LTPVDNVLHIQENFEKESYFHMSCSRIRTPLLSWMS